MAADITAAILAAKVVIDGLEKAKSDLDSVGDKAKQTQSKMQIGLGAIGPMAATGTGAILALGVATVSMAGNFQSGITTLQTGAGEAASNLGKVSDGILQLAQDTGTSTAQLTAGMYMIGSAGYHGAQGLDALKYAAEGAKVGNADLGTVANAETTIMTDYKNAHVSAAQAVNDLIATVAQGKTTMQDLSGALSSILPTASAAGVGLNDVMGAMATMTGEGVPAADAATYLRQTLIALEAPSKQTTKALADVGLSTSDVAKEMQKSLPDALKMITDAVGKKFPVGSAAYVQALKDISGGSKEMQGILDLTGSHMQTFADNAKNIGDTASKSGNNIQGWSKVQDDFNFKMDQAREVVETLGIKIGTVLLPPIGTVVGKLTDFVKWIQGSSEGAQILRPILIGVAIAIGGALVAAFIAWAFAAGAAAVATIAATWPILLIGAAIALLVAGIILLWTHWSTIWPAITQFAQVAWKAIQDTWNEAISFFTKTIPDAISGGFKTALNGAIDLINGFIGFLDGLKVDIPGGPSIHLNIGKIPHLAEGGTLLSSGSVLVGEKGPELLQLPSGARVQPLSSNERSAPSHKTIIINAATQTVDTYMLNRIDRRDNLLARVGR